jgi:hypothetical protein
MVYLAISVRTSRPRLDHVADARMEVNIYDEDEPSGTIVDPYEEEPG